MSSHDPTQDKTSLTLIAIVVMAAAVGLVVLIVGGIRARRDTDEPTLLHEVEGCKVFRFKDLGEIHYYVDCPNRSATTYAIKGDNNSIITEYNP